MPVDFRPKKAFRDFRSTWAQFHVDIPTTFDERPEFIRKPDGWGIIWFVRVTPFDREGDMSHQTHVAEWDFTCKDLHEVNE